MSVCRCVGVSVCGKVGANVLCARTVTGAGTAVNNVRAHAVGEEAWLVEALPPAPNHVHDLLRDACAWTRQDAPAHQQVGAVLCS